MTNNEILDKLLTLITEIERDIWFDKTAKNVILYGVPCTKSDFANFKAVIEHCKGLYSNNIKASYTYIQNNKDYNRVTANLNYYKRKDDKTEKDYAKMEELLNRLEDIKKDRAEKKRKMIAKRLEKQLDKVEYVDDFELM